MRNLRVFVDDIEAASLRPGSAQVIQISSGRHAIVGRMDWCRSKELTVEAEEGNSIAIELSYPMSALFDTFFRPRQAIAVTLLP